MRKWYDGMGMEVDLDDESIYSYLPTTYKGCYDEFMKQVGEAYWYITFIHKDWDPKQVKRIYDLVQKFTDERYIDRTIGEKYKWMRETLWIFIEETENMC